MAMELNVGEREARARFAAALVRGNCQGALALRTEERLGTRRKVDAGGHDTEVTAADFENSKWMLNKVRQQFGQDHIVDEEGNGTLTMMDLQWKVVWVGDGIDGSRMYRMGLHFGSSLAACEGGVPTAGAIAIDNGDVFMAFGGSKSVYRNNAVYGPPAIHERKNTVVNVEGLHWLWHSEADQRSPEGDILAALRAEFRNVDSFQSFVRQASLVFTGEMTAAVHAGIDLFSAAAVWLIARQLGLVCCRWNGESLFPHVMDVAAADFARYRGSPYVFDVMLSQGEHALALRSILEQYSGFVERYGAVKRFRK